MMPSASTSLWRVSCKAKTARERDETISISTSFCSCWSSLNEREETSMCKEKDSEGMVRKLQGAFVGNLISLKYTLELRRHCRNKTRSTKTFYRWTGRRTAYLCTRMSARERSGFQNKSQILVPLFPSKVKSTIQTLVAFLKFPALPAAAYQNYSDTLKHGKCWISFSLYVQWILAGQTQA